MKRIITGNIWALVLSIFIGACSAESNGKIESGAECNQINLLSNRNTDPDGNPLKEVNLTNTSDQQITFTVKITEISGEEKESRSETYPLAPKATVNLGCNGKWTKNILKGEERFINYQYEIIDAVEE